MKKLLLVCVVLLSGCLQLDYLSTEPTFDREYVVRIESDGSWEGYIGNWPFRQYVSGWGNRSFRTNRPTCWDIQLRSRYAYVRAFGTTSGYYSNSGSRFPTWGDHSTTRQYSFISGCF
jgi:hypothetical protein